MPFLAPEALRRAYRWARRRKNRLLNRLDPPLIVLGYHRVAEKNADPSEVAVSTANFLAQLEHVKRTCRILPLDDAGRRPKGPALALTFDDGYADSLSKVLPVLEELALPATFFVTSAVRHFWWDELERLVLGGSGHPATFRLGPQGRVWPSATAGERLSLCRDLTQRLLESPAARREEHLEQLRAWRGASEGNEGAPRALEPDELKALAASPFASIGAHSATHPRLSSLPEAAQREEIEGSRRSLETLIGTPVTSFAYPFGSRRDYDRTSVRLCRQAGFSRAVTTEPGQVHRWTDPWQLPRQLVRNWDGDTFSKRLAELWA